MGQDLSAKKTTITSKSKPRNASSSAPKATIAEPRGDIDPRPADATHDADPRPTDRPAPNYTPGT